MVGAVLGVAAVVAVAAWFVVKGSAKTEQTNDAQVSEVAAVADKVTGESLSDAAAASSPEISGAETETVTTTSTTQSTSSLSPLSIDNDVPADGEESSDSGTVDPMPSNNAQVNSGTASTGLAVGAPDNDVVVE